MGEAMLSTMITAQKSFNLLLSSDFCWPRIFQRKSIVFKPFLVLRALML